MAGEFLNQEEIDYLLKDLVGIDQKFVAEEVEDTSGAIKPYELGRQERIVRGRMPTLEIINERFARMLRIGVFDMMRKNPEISTGQVKVQKYSEFMRNLIVPTNLNIITLSPLRGSSLMVIDPSLIFTIVDQMFGGTGQVYSRIEGREFTQTEQRIIRKFLDVILERYKTAWSPVHEIEPEFLRSEMHTQFANIATPSEIVLSTSFNIEVGSGSGSIHICLPYNSIEPIRELLYSSMQGDQMMEPDHRWAGNLQAKIKESQVGLQAVLSKTKLTLADLEDLDVGDVIPIEIENKIDVCVSGVPVYRGVYGQSNRHYSVKVEEILDLPNLNQQKELS